MLAQAERVARALGGAQRAGRNSWLAFCPCHKNTDTPALCLTDSDNGILLVTCHTVPACDRVDILQELRRSGLLDDKRPDPVRRRPAPAISDNERLAIALWAQCQPIPGTLGEVHLTRRGLVLPPGAEMRFHRRCPRGRDRQPAIVWLMRDIFTNQPRAVQRRFLLPDGTKDGKAQSLGPTAGTCWKLSADEDVTIGLGIAEGYSDALAALNDEWAPVWASCGAGGMAAFPVLDGVEALTLFVQNDEPARRAAEACAARWRAAGKAVRFAPTPAGYKDFADLKVPS